MALRGAILDVDGTVLRGDEPIPGAREGLETIADAGLGRLFVSNNPTKPPSAYEARFEAAGLSVDAREVLTAGSVTTEYLASEHPDDDLYVLGEPGLLTQLRDAGLTVVDDAEAVDVLVASLDRGFDYDDLSTALWTLTDPAVTFLGTDPDAVIPGPERDYPGSGAVINAVAGVAGRDPERVLGKPSPEMRTSALDRLGVPPEDCLVVGDRLDTDVALGAEAGMTTVLVRSGIATGGDLEASDVHPDYVLDSLGEIDRVLDAESVARR